MSENPSTTASTEALASAIAAATSQSQSELLSPISGGDMTAVSASFTASDYSLAMTVANTIDPVLAAPFPKLLADTDDTGTVVANSVDPMPLPSQPPLSASTMVSPALTAAMGVSTEAMTAVALSGMMANSQEQVLELMGGTYAANASHRRRSSVEAAAAASSVLASIANSKSRMENEMARAAASMTAVATGNGNNSGPSSQNMNSYGIAAANNPHSSQQSAAAALLAASNMQSGMLPPIPSGSNSLQGTPAPGQRLSISSNGGDDAAAAAAAAAAMVAAVGCSADVTAAMEAFDVSAFNGLPPGAYSNNLTDVATIETSLPSATTTIDTKKSTGTKPRQTRRRKKKTTTTKTVSKDAAVDDSHSDDDGSESDGLVRGHIASNGMPLTPDAPGSGRPGSLRHLTLDERRARRLQRNRLAAKECRQKKKAYITNLESQVSDLKEENAELRKEVDELNAKLTLSGMRANSSATTPTLESKRLFNLSAVSSGGDGSSFFGADHDHDGEDSAMNSLVDSSSKRQRLTEQMLGAMDESESNEGQ